MDVIKKAIEQGRKMLSEHESKKLLAAVNSNRQPQTLGIP